MLPTCRVINVPSPLKVMTQASTIILYALWPYFLQLHEGLRQWCFSSRCRISDSHGSEMEAKGDK